VQAMDVADLKELLQETRWIRKLLVLKILASGYQQKDIAAVMDVSEATLSRMLPKGLSKKNKS
jgi:hypothetical protein